MGHAILWGGGFLVYIVIEIVTVEFDIKFFKLTGIQINKKYHVFLNIVFVFLFYMVSSALIEIDRAENSPDKSVTFSYEDSKILTSESLIYLGQTSKFLFIYDKTTKKAKIFERERITNFTIELVSEEETE